VFGGKEDFSNFADLVEFAGLVVGETLLHWELRSFVVAQAEGQFDR
jgi:hypothetical protein